LKSLFIDNFIFYFIEINKQFDTWSIDDDNFKINYQNEDKKILILDDDLSSTITNSESYFTESNSYKEEILPFTIDKIALKEAWELFENNNNEDIINWKEIDFKDEKLETESVNTSLIEEN